MEETESAEGRVECWRRLQRASRKSVEMRIRGGICRRLEIGMYEMQMNSSIHHFGWQTVEVNVGLTEFFKTAENKMQYCNSADDIARL